MFVTVIYSSAAKPVPDPRLLLEFETLAERCPHHHPPIFFSSSGRQRRTTVVEKILKLMSGDGERSLAYPTIL